MRFTTCFAATALFTALSAPLAFAADVMPANGMLVNASGMTVYVFDKDVADSGKSACSGGCLVALARRHRHRRGARRPVWQHQARRQRCHAADLQGQAPVPVQGRQEAGRCRRRQLQNVWHVVKP